MYWCRLVLVIFVQTLYPWIQRKQTAPNPSSLDPITPSMRRQAAEYENRMKRLEDQSVARFLAVRLLKEGNPIRTTARATKSHEALFIVLTSASKRTTPSSFRIWLAPLPQLDALELLTLKKQDSSTIVWSPLPHDNLLLESKTLRTFYPDCGRRS